MRPADPQRNRLIPVCNQLTPAPRRHHGRVMVPTSSPRKEPSRKNEQHGDYQRISPLPKKHEDKFRKAYWYKYVHLLNGRKR
ncbi:hypothetical protein CDAR_253181 [Caerostris darwini]|uniref:Uncharacterized protein n=1 Tax=Caerostris darwini TaxID=1538125 RepID=A0AAV4R999_9ARAC|nr:hypothetical protein CDAR_253181 [Caerostris darwini]